MSLTSTICQLEAYRRLVALRKKLIEKARQDYDTLAKNANSDSRVSVCIRMQTRTNSIPEHIEFYDRMSRLQGMATKHSMTTMFTILVFAINVVVPFVNNER